MQARVVVVDDEIRKYMLENNNEGIEVRLENPQNEIVLNQVVKSHELITYKTKQSKEKMLMKAYFSKVIIFPLP